jgi:hypothetical protein
VEGPTRPVDRHWTVHGKVLAIVSDRMALASGTTTLPQQDTEVAYKAKLLVAAPLSASGCSCLHVCQQQQARPWESRRLLLR